MDIMLAIVGRVTDATDVTVLDILPEIVAMKLAVSVCRSLFYFFIYFTSNFTDFGTKVSAVFNQLAHSLNCNFCKMF
jgi:hypothetical protein